MQGPRNLTAGMLARIANHLAGMAVAATHDLVRDIVYFQHMRTGTEIRHERAPACDTFYIAFVR